MRRLRMIAGMVVVAVLAIGLAVGGPRLLRSMSLFEVRSVEVTGTRLLSAQDVIAAAGIQEGQNLWEDREIWLAALDRHPAIASARIRRRPPGTLRVAIEERRAVAYVDDGSLALMTGAGERLPVDPARNPVDLPIARGHADAPVPAGLFRETERLADLIPGLLAEVSEIQSGDSLGSVLILRHPRAEIVIPAGATAQRLAELRAVLADLERRTDPEHARRVARVDLRFAEQVVVRPPPSVSMP